MRLPPAPWYVDPDDRPGMGWNNHVLSADGHTVCFMAHNPNGSNEPHENAAHAISALPDLMESVRELAEELELRMARNGETTEAARSNADEDPGAAFGVLKRARQAINKAERQSK